MGEGGRYFYNPSCFGPRRLGSTRLCARMFTCGRSVFVMFAPQRFAPLRVDPKRSAPLKLQPSQALRGSSFIKLILSKACVVETPTSNARAKQNSKPEHKKLPLSASVAKGWPKQVLYTTGKRGSHDHVALRDAA